MFNSHLLHAYLEVMGGERGSRADVLVPSLSSLGARPLLTALLGTFLAVAIQGGSKLLMTCDESERLWFALASQRFFYDTVQSNLSQSRSPSQLQDGRAPQDGPESSTDSPDPDSASALSAPSSPDATYDWNQSTEFNYCSPTTRHSGPYASIRRDLDPHFHSTYSEARQRLQDAIVSSLLHQSSPPPQRTRSANEKALPPPPQWIVFSAGAMGSGKTWTFQLLHAKGRFPLQSFVTVDPDQIRQRLPEFPGYVQRCPERAGERTRKECGLVAEILTQAALRAGRNVLVDGSLRNATWYREYFDQLRREHSHVRLAIVHVVAPREVVLERALNRSKVTGRVVPQDLLERTIREVPVSFALLRDVVDFAVEIRNAGPEGHGDNDDDVDGNDVQLVDPPMSWQEFEQRWGQAYYSCPLGQDRVPT